jgi:uncharacterized protein (TIGR02594 family)
MKTAPILFLNTNKGFEIRTTQRCNKVEIYTNAASLLKTKTYDFVYLDELVAESELPLNRMSMLAKVQVTGHNGEATESMPPLTFAYSKFTPQNRDFYPISGGGPATSLSSPDLELVDLTGDGLPDILQMNGVQQYWPNLGNGQYGLPKNFKEAPPFELADPAVQLLDADGDGRAELLVNKPGYSGYYPSRFGGMWDKKSFQFYDVAPSFSFEDPQVRMMDLDGDGVTDVLRNGADSFECFYNHPVWGFYKTGLVKKKTIDDFPDVNFADPRIKMASISGSGMQDIAYVASGRTDYWPNLGYGKFGPRISMKNSPRFGYGFNPARLLVGDIDGDGLADIVYIENNQITLWINQCGNSWSDPVVIKGTPPVSDMDSVRLADILGSGVSGILFSATLTSSSTNSNKRGWAFLDFTAGNKPYLLQEMNNNMGSITRVEYKSSTTYYLQDQVKPETRWKSPLPFPVLVVSKVEVIDALSLGKLATEYSYHHGYWDGVEREFRGFGRVDQRDTETFTRYNTETILENGIPVPALPDQKFDTVSEEYYTPPTETRTWFHQGPMGDEFGGWYEADYTHEYWKGDPQVLERSPQQLREWKSLPRRAYRDALRTLRGNVLRTELYALDNTPLKSIPYTVTESISFTRTVYIPDETGVPLNAANGSKPNTFKYASGYIFFPFALAQRSTQWERGNDPMTSFSFTENYDDYGQPQTSISIAVPRGKNYKISDIHTGLYLATRSDTEFIYKGTLLDTANGLFFVNRTQTAKGYDYTHDAADDVFTFKDTIADESSTHTLLSHSLSFYDGDAYEGESYGVLGDYGVVTRSEMLMVTPAILSAAYGGTPNLLEQTPDFTDYPAAFETYYDSTFVEYAGYLYKDGTGNYEEGYYTYTARNMYDFQELTPTSEKGLIAASIDPLGNLSTISYDEYLFLPISVKQYISPPDVSNIYLETTADYDYRVLQPFQVTDPNENISVFDFSELGLLRATALIGKGTEGDYKDSSGGFYDKYEPSSKLEYDFFNFVNNGDPVWVKTTKREFHYQQDPDPDKTIVSVEYSDGFGRLLQTRTQAEDIIYYTDNDNSWTGDSGLPADQSDPNDDAIGHIRDTEDPLNVVVSGWQIYNNKGKVVEKYEPFFDSGFDYKLPFENGQENPGQKITMFYDPRGQVVRTVNPDASEQRVVFGVPLALDTPTSYSPTPWESYTYDAEDLDVSSDHYATPKSAEVDALGRSVKTIDRLVSNNEAGDNVRMLYEYDIRGNLLEVTDALNRKVFEYVYDLRPPAKEGESIPPLKTVHIDKGTSTIVFDCMGKPLQGDDAKGARTLSAFDELMRPTDAWARDVTGEDITLRQHLIYGTDASVDVNTKGKLYEQYDEAGYQRMDSYDFKGNLLHKFRQVIADSELLSVFSGPPVGWDVQCYRVDWTGLPSILDAKEYHTDMTYDALNRIMTLEYPEDTDNQRKVLTPAYNKAGALFSVNLDGTDYVKEIAYNAKGQRLLIALGNDWMTRYTYDPLTFRLQRLKTEKFVYTSAGGTVTYEPQSGTTRQDFAYTYDWVGNILSINNETPACGVGGSGSLLREFEYDALYRLISGTGRENQPSTAFPGWEDTTRSDTAGDTTAYTQYYSYDRMGNFDEFQHVASSSPNNFTRDFSYISGKNLLNKIEIGSNVYQFNYDNNGNLITENTERHFEWDYADQMRCFFNQTGTSEPSVYTQYLYAGGTRVKKITRKSSGDKYVTVYIDGIFEHSYHLDGSNAMDEVLNELHVMDDQTRVAMLRTGYDDGTPDTKYILSDHLGSSNVILETSGAVYNREEYYPFGETSFGSFGKKRYRYVGKEKDEESGLYYYGMRYYQPWSCRFISVDPLAADYPFYTSYQYAGNQPINFIDLDGAEQAPAQGGNTGATPTGDTTTTTTSGAATTTTGGTTPVVKPNYHAVKQDENLGVIAKKYGITIEALRCANGLDPKCDGDLSVGTNLEIPTKPAPKPNWNAVAKTTTTWVYNGNAIPAGEQWELLSPYPKTFGPDAPFTPTPTKPVPLGTEKGSKSAETSSQEGQSGGGAPWMNTALAEYKAGVKEVPKGSNSGPKVDVYLAYAGVSSPNKWCASFVHWCLGQNNIKGAGAQGSSYLNWGIEIDKPVYGAIVIFKTGHVGFYMGTNSDGTLIILHGNWSDKVSISKNISPNEIKAYRMPRL